ncbi:MAG: hypothetical protein MUE73_15670 [Planctomycetes bacterium]|jgi:hypothetical protein|nr:hypothetical protein [Planctomycetota bacterium]
MLRILLSAHEGPQFVEYLGIDLPELGELLGEGVVGVDFGPDPREIRLGHMPKAGPPAEGSDEVVGGGGPFLVPGAEEALDERGVEIGAWGEEELLDAGTALEEEAELVADAAGIGTGRHVPVKYTT